MNDFEKTINICKYVLYNFSGEEVSRILNKSRRTVQTYRKNPRLMTLDTLEKLYQYYEDKH